MSTCGAGPPDVPGMMSKAATPVRGSSSFWEEFVRPLPLAAVALLVVNDRFLKASFGNFLTGKLSDLAICFFLPIYLAALFARSGIRSMVRVSAGCVATVVVFVGQETSTQVVAVLTATLTPMTRMMGMRQPLQFTMDLTDLWALLVVPLALLYATRTHRRREVQ